MFRGFLADERRNEQREFGPAFQLCFDLSRGFEPVNRLHFGHEVFVAMLGWDFDHCIETAICRGWLVGDNGAQTGTTMQRCQSVVEDFLARLVHNSILYT